MSTRPAHLPGPSEAPVGSSARVLLHAAHAGPTLAVTVLMGLLALAQGLRPESTVLLVAAVLTGQLSVGWSNDLLDRSRDRAAGRADKPLAADDGAVALVRAACAAAVVVCVALSLSLGPAAGLVHLGCVASAWCYNLGLKATVWSWLPYALSFGGLTAVVTLADGEAPPWWWPVGAALLGVGAHLLNVLPDLADDAATGVRGLPHRLGPRLIAPVAAAVLVVATGVVLAGSAPPVPASLTVAVVVLGLAAVVVSRTGRAPFAAAVAIALVDALLLVVAR
ncbi:UbiA family prenyltransferase [Nocardioides sp. zg-1228]|uniref:UbiA family prenyltransferase n=1 Tax=Nocardioides sp. zg-1228 TaxID=2763008 RepID=UPI001642A944|nr:UbiA family prenyltransferase [Nocardioides sp. zg-1228]MBC2933585.1 UbiA family prenyltransferase [Nocardioides sp. zg-1228]QSF56288.1 UbiA family prenyltransferase [Nocardioides sp. zg-1228]